MGHTVYTFNKLTTGLHYYNIDKLMKILTNPATEVI